MEYGGRPYDPTVPGDYERYRDNPTGDAPPGGEWDAKLEKMADEVGDRAAGGYEPSMDGSPEAYADHILDWYAEDPPPPLDEMEGLAFALSKPYYRKVIKAAVLEYIGMMTEGRALHEQYHSMSPAGKSLSRSIKGKFMRMYPDASVGIDGREGWITVNGKKAINMSQASGRGMSDEEMIDKMHAVYAQSQVDPDIPTADTRMDTFMEGKMKISKRQLRRIIKEEKSRVLSERRMQIAPRRRRSVLLTERSLRYVARQAIIDHNRGVRIDENWFSDVAKKAKAFVADKVEDAQIMFNDFKKKLPGGMAKHISKAYKKMIRDVKEMTDKVDFGLYDLKAIEWQPDSMEEALENGKIVKKFFDDFNIDMDINDLMGQENFDADTEYDLNQKFKKSLRDVMQRTEFYVFTDTEIEKTKKKIVDALGEKKGKAVAEEMAEELVATMKEYEEDVLSRDYADEISLAVRGYAKSLAYAAEQEWAKKMDEKERRLAGLERMKIADANEKAAWKKEERRKDRAAKKKYSTEPEDRTRSKWS